MISALALLCVIVMATPVAFSAIHKNSGWMETCYWITESAGKIGTALIVLITALVYTRRLKSDLAIMKTFVRSSIMLFLIIGCFAFINENLTKKVLKIHRPSLSFVSEKCRDSFSFTELYNLEKEKRTPYILESIKECEGSFSDIDEWVILHWADESGYSFPSGHSFNAFLLACVLSFSMYFSRSPRVRPFFVIPPIWALFVAVSRVALGAHSAVDVMAGAAMGLTIGIIFISWDDVRNLVLHRKHDV